MKADTLSFRLANQEQSNSQILEVHLEPNRSLVADGKCLFYVDEEVDLLEKTDVDLNQDQKTTTHTHEDDLEEDWTEGEQDVEEPIFGKVWRAVRGFFQQEKKKSSNPFENDFNEQMFDAPSQAEPTQYFCFFHNSSEYIRTVAFAAPLGGTIVSIDLNKTNTPKLYIKPEAFLCLAKGIEWETVQLEPELDWLELSGLGLVFLQSKGFIQEKSLQEDDAIQVNLQAILAFEGTIDINPSSKPTFRSLDGTETIQLVSLTGNGKIWLQSGYYQFTPGSNTAKSDEDPATPQDWNEADFMNSLESEDQ